MIKKELVFGAAGLFLGLATVGVAGQIINLVSGQQVVVQGVTVTCDTNPDPGNSSTSLGSSVVTFQGQTYQLMKGAAGNGLVRNLNTGVVRDLGGTIIDNPIGFVYNNQLYIIARGIGQEPFYATLTQGWTSMGGQIIDFRIVMYRNEPYFVARGTDKTVFYTTLSHSWTSLGGTALDFVSVSVFGDDLLIQVTGTDNLIHQRTLTTDWVRAN